MPKDLDSVTDLGKYVVEYIAADRLLQAEQRYWLSQIDAPGQSMAEAQDATNLATSLSLQIIALSNVHTTILAKYAPGGKPPSASMIQKAQELTAALGKAIHKTTAAKQIAKLVSKFVGDWSTL